MRYLLGFLCVCALGVVPLVGCDLSWDNSDPCEGVVCPDDGNECTNEFCSCVGLFCTATCKSRPAADGTDCTFGGLSGVCVSGVCGDNLCEGVVCDDDDACTDDVCDYVDGTCDFAPVVCDDYDDCTEDTCDPVDGMCNFTTAEDGTPCIGDLPLPLGMCEAGTCVAPCDPASEEELQCPVKGFEFQFCCVGVEFCLPECSGS